METVTVEMSKDKIEASVELPHVVISFKVREGAVIRAEITEDGRLYVNGNWGNLVIAPESANSCFLSLLPIGTRIESEGTRVDLGAEDGQE